MNAGAYTNRGEEVPLGVECALPYGAGRPLQNEKGTFPSKEIEAFLVFGLLAAAMIVTRKLDWYALGAPRPAPA